MWSVEKEEIKQVGRKDRGGIVVENEQIGW